tara:strand:+ start:350 stop:679 length:330 start_codon:yes stop_codon:yes gene_type:complete
MSEQDDPQDRKPTKLVGGDKYGFKKVEQSNYSVLIEEREYEETIEAEFSIGPVETDAGQTFEINFEGESGIFSAEDICKFASLLTRGISEATGSKLYITDDGRVEIIPF